QPVYYTSFDASEGYDTTSALSGQKGWTNFNSGQNGFIFNSFGDSTYQGYLGYNSPVLGGTCWLWHPLNFTPNTNSRPVVVFSTYLSIEDSSNFQYDVFDWDFFNRAGAFLFSLEFNNFTLDINYSLDDHAGSKWTGQTFRNGSVYYLQVTMD